jgi:hypothetical protein
MALTRISGEQISDNWHVIRLAIKNSAMPTADTGEPKMKNILESLLKDRAICWVDGNPDKPRTVIVTSITEEEISGTKNLLIYCAHGFGKASSAEYLDMVQTLGDYARGMECDNIISYVWNDKIIRLLEKYGAETNYTLVVMPLR